MTDKALDAIFDYADPGTPTHFWRKERAKDRIRAALLHAKWEAYHDCKTKGGSGETVRKYAGSRAELLAAESERYPSGDLGA